MSVLGADSSAQDFSSAARTGAMAGAAFDKGASMAMKMDQLLEQQEAKLYNRQQQAQQNLQKGLQTAMDNKFRAQQMQFNKDQFAETQKQNMIGNAYKDANLQLNQDNSESVLGLRTQQTEAATRKNTNAKTALTNIPAYDAKAKSSIDGVISGKLSNFGQLFGALQDLSIADGAYETSGQSKRYTEAGALIKAKMAALSKGTITPADRMKHIIEIAKGLPTKDPLTNIAYDNKEIMNQATNRYNEFLATVSGTQPSGVPTQTGTSGKPPATLPGVGTYQAAIDNDTFVNAGRNSVGPVDLQQPINNALSQYTDGQLDILNTNIINGDDTLTGDGLLNGALAKSEEYINDPRFIDNVLIPGLLSTNTNTAQKAQQVYQKNLPPETKAIVDNKRNEYLVASSQYDGKDIVIPKHGDNTVFATQTNSAEAFVNEELSANSLEDIVNAVNNKSTFGVAIGKGLDWITDGQDTAIGYAKASAVNKKFELEQGKALKQFGTHANAYSLFSTIVDYDVTDAKNWKFGWGMTGNNIKNLNTPWNMKAEGLTPVGKKTGKKVSFSKFIPGMNDEMIQYFDNIEAGKDNRPFKFPTSPASIIPAIVDAGIRTFGGAESKTANIKGYHDSLSPDQQMDWKRNINRLAVTMKKHVKDRKLMTDDGKMLLDTRSNVSLPVKLVDAESRQPSSVNMTLQEMSVLYVYLTRGLTGE